MIKEAIVLAGGLGSRLRDAVPGLPKCLAPVAGRPFLSHLVDYLRLQGIERFVFSLGYEGEMIEAYLRENYATLDFVIAMEKDPAGTGGGIKLALTKTVSETVLVANGDTLFRISVKELEEMHRRNNAECTLALKPLQQFNRYGIVETDKKGRIILFREKQFYENGLVNGGVYLLNKQAFLARPLNGTFSFEKDYLEKFSEEGKFFGLVQPGYFIDIGIPEDYQRAQNDLRRPALDLKQIDKTWTLFLDRDGVINEERIGEYILHWGEFIFGKGVLDVFKKLGVLFGRVIVVSNQRGVGKGLMTEEALQSIHFEMQREVEIVSGKIDKIYYCTEKDDQCFNRKPNPGMALMAIRDFPDIDLAKSIMVGNKPSDMKFGRSAGMYTVFVKTTNPDQEFPHPDIDMTFPSLYDFAAAL